MALAYFRDQFQAIGSGHIEIDQRDVHRTHGGERIICIGGFDQGPFRSDPPERARHHHPGKLAVVDNQNFVGHSGVSRG
jgi:hypothetical protein